MAEKNLLIITNNYPNDDNSYIGDIFVKEQIKFLKNHFDTVYVISPVAYGMERLRKTTHRNYYYDNVRVFFPKYFNFPFFYDYGRQGWIFFEINAIKKLIEVEKITFSVIHAHFTWPSGAVATHLKRIYNVPVIVTEGSSKTLHKELMKKNHHYINTYKKCDGIIRNNFRDLPLFYQAGIPREKIFNVDYGYDPKKFYPISMAEARKILGIDPQRKILVNISRLYEEKGQKFLIEAMVKVLGKYPDCVCYLGGTGPSQESLEKLIRSLNLEDNIKMIGFVPDESLLTWINSADLFVLPSLMEGNPTIMLECIGCGVPFVGTDVGGIPEVIISDEYGLIARPADSDDLAEKLIYGLDRQWKRDDIGNYAKKFSGVNSAEKILEIYRKVGYSTVDRH
jgi:glycosyltransferase involved in cell wall biosynthesis